MLSVNADKYWLLYTTLWCLFPPTNGEGNCQDSFGLETVRRPLGSSVMLLCGFGDTSPNFTFDYWVSWSHASSELLNLTSEGKVLVNLMSEGKVLVNLTSEGKVHFQDPRYGRLKVFPFQGSEGNYSIRIDDLQPSDLGCYRCENGNEFHQVQVEQHAEQGAETSKEAADDIRLLVYVSAGVAATILVLSACCYSCVKCARFWIESPPDDYVNCPANIAVCSGTPSGGNTENIDRAGQHESTDNDEHDPDRHSSDLTNDQDPTGIICHAARNQTEQTDIQQYPTASHCNVSRMKVHGRNQGFHRELISRLRQASLNRHYYANQAEINQQAASSQTENRHRVSFWRKKDRQKCEYKNPIYNGSTDQLNKL